MRQQQRNSEALRKSHFDFGIKKNARKLRDKLWREEKNRKSMEIIKTKRSRAKTLVRAAGVKTSDPKADKKLMQVPWKRRNALRSPKTDIMNISEWTQASHKSMGALHGH